MLRSLGDPQVSVGRLSEFAKLVAIQINKPWEFVSNDRGADTPDNEFSHVWGFARSNVWRPRGP